jgi:hypothetical protein
MRFFCREITFGVAEGGEGEADGIGLSLKKAPADDK